MSARLSCLVWCGVTIAAFFTGVLCRPCHAPPDPDAARIVVIACDPEQARKMETFAASGGGQTRMAFVFKDHDTSRNAYSDCVDLLFARGVGAK